MIDLHDPGTPERQAAYRADITYGTNNEFGFDYLRDNMVHSLEQRVQRDHDYAIIDEVDSILIDEARTPLIISGPVGQGHVDAVQAVQPAGVAASSRSRLRITNELRERGREAPARPDERVRGGREAARGEAGHAEAQAAHEAVRRRPVAADARAARSKPTSCGRSGSTSSTRCCSSPWTRRATTSHLSDKGLDELSPERSRCVHRARPLRGAGRRSRTIRDALGRREARAHPGARGRVRGEEPEDPRHPSAPEGVHALREGREVHHRRGRPGRHRRRVHRPADGRAVAGATGSTRRSRPRRASRSGARRRRSRRSPSRTTSGCTTSSPA